MLAPFLNKKKKLLFHFIILLGLSSANAASCPELVSSAKTIVIVDAYSSGEALAREFKRKGHRIVHVQSRNDVHSMFSKHRHSVAKIFDVNLSFTGKFEDLFNSLKALKPDIVLAGMESGVILADRLSQRLGVVTNGEKLSSARRNKYVMNEVVRSYGLEAVKQLKTADADEAIKFATENVSFPVIVKPLDSGGTFGVRTCSSVEEIEKTFEKLVGDQTLYGDQIEELLVQEFLQGKEYVVNTVGMDGDTLISDIWEYKKLDVQNATAIYDADTLLPFNGDIQQRIVGYAFKVLKALEIFNGAAHIEIKMVPGRGPVLIEVGARLAGAGMPKYAQLGIAEGLNQMALTVERYTEPEKFRSRLQLSKGYELEKNVSIVAINAPKGGETVSLEALEQMRELKSFYEYSVFYKDGEKVKKTVDEATKVGQVILVHEDDEQLRSDYETIREWEASSFFSD